MKIIGVGLNKTGTTTLGTCLKHWGFRHISWSLEAFHLWLDRDFDALFNIMESCDSFEDWPWPLCYREIDAKYPRSKFILTRRMSADKWFESLCKHAERTGPTLFRERIYGYAMPQDHKEEHIQFYHQHNDAVREYFQNRPSDLLEVCWEEGDGWTELSEFLGFEKPTIPFPHENKSVD